MPRTVGFVNCFLRYTPDLPWLQGIRQRGRYTSGGIRKRFTKPTVQGILSIGTSLRFIGYENTVAIVNDGTWDIA